MKRFLLIIICHFLGLSLIGQDTLILKFNTLDGGASGSFPTPGIYTLTFAGQIMYQESFQSPSTISLSIGHFTPGVYLVKYTDDDGIAESRKIFLK